MIIGPVVELELPKHNDVLPEEYFNEANCLFFQSFFHKIFFFIERNIRM